MMRKSDMIVGIILVIFSVLVYFNVSYFPKIQLAAQGMGPAFFPRILSIFLALLGIILIIQSYVTSTKYTKDIENVIDTRLLIRIIIALSVIIMYVFLIPHIGFLIATFIFTIIFMGFFNFKYSFKMIIISLVISAIIFYLFKVILHMPLPSGKIIGGL